MDTFLRLQVYMVCVSMLLVILVKLIIDKDIHNFHNKLFTLIICFTLFVLVCEAISWVFNGRPGYIGYLMSILSNMFEHMLVLIPGILWMAYVDYYIYNNKLRIKKLFIISGILLIYLIILSVTAPFNGMLFYIDNSNTYHRGALYWQSQFISYLFPAYVILILLINRKRINNEIFIPLLLFPLPPLIGMLIQILFFGVSTAWIGVSISILIVYIYIQSQKNSIDYLTGLHNRRQLDLYLESVAKNHTYNEIICILMIDIDKFKEINDTWGHEMGDRALKQFAMILKRCFHCRDFIARYAGDEFVVVLEVENTKDADKVVKRLKDTVSTSKSTEDIPYNLGFSIGYGLFPYDGQDIYKVLRTADERMYIEKSDMKAQD